MKAKRNWAWSWVMLLGTSVCASTAAHADLVQLQAYTGVVAGANECPGGGPPPALSFFSTGVGFGIGAGGDGISDCGLSGSINNVIKPGTTPAVSATNLNGGGYVGGTGTYTGAANATAHYGALTVAASGSLTGSEPANGIAESVAFAIADDTINIAGNGSGFVAFQYTINGGLSQSANDLAAGAIEVQVQLGSSPDRAFYADVSESSSVVSGLFGDPVPGCTTGIGSFNCVNGTFSTTMLPITFGTNTAYDFGLIVGTELLQGASSIDPAPGLSLTGIEVFNAAGTPISNFSITSGSGAVYGATGLVSGPGSAAPEPALQWLLATALGFIFMAARWRRRGLTKQCCS